MIIDRCLNEISLTYNISVRESAIWDRQTVVILCYSSDIMEHVMSTLRRNMKPSSHTGCNGYQIDGFVNINYDKYELDPANRNVRVVYCNMDIMDIDIVYDRFPNSHIISVWSRKENENGQPRFTCREVSEISRN